MRACLIAFLVLGISADSRQARVAATSFGDVVISQIYAGGGNANAIYSHDFVELFNRGPRPVDLTGWSLQSAPARTGSWAKVDLGGTIPPGGYYLVQLAAGGSRGEPLPLADADGTRNLGATSGKVALVSDSALLDCGAVDGDCRSRLQIRDLVGWGRDANNAEGPSSASAPSAVTAIFRSAAGCTDTEDNRADYVLSRPSPRNSSSPGVTCGPPAPVHIHDVQGRGHLSPLAIRDVTVSGIVTAVKSNGFFIQDVDPDDDVATSEGIFVLQRGCPSVAVADRALVVGTVTEFRGTPPTSLTVTDLLCRVIQVLDDGQPLPAPVLLGASGRRPPAGLVSRTVGDVEFPQSGDAASEALDFFESLEGMRVEVRDAVVVGPFDEELGLFAVLADDGVGAGPRTMRGGIYDLPGDPNPERLLVDPSLLGVPAVSVGDRADGPIVGLLDYQRGSYRLLSTSLPSFIPGGLERETASDISDGVLGVATFNLENLDALDEQSRFDQLAERIVDHLRSPDILAVQEAQDANGATNGRTRDGVVDASATFTRLVDAIFALGGPRYAFVDIAPEEGRDGGEPGGNIRVGFLYRTDRGLGFVGRPGGDATTPARIDPGLTLSFNPGRIEPGAEAFSGSRKPLVAEFVANGRPLFVINLHLVARLADDPLFGRIQPPERHSEPKRLRQAALVSAFVGDLLARDPQARLIVLGDLNDFWYSDVLAELKSGGLTNLTESLPEDERYTAIFQGNSQALDHILVSSSLLGSVVEYDIVHVNVEFAEQASDHDPARALFRFPPAE